MANVSLTVIAKNEEQNLAACISPLARLVQEIVVVDTGSTDGTRAIAQKLGAKVVDYPWTDSFADARNQGIEHATGDWIFWMDADDRIDPLNCALLERLFKSLGDQKRGVELHIRSASRVQAEIIQHVRLFPRQANIRWEFRVHEQIYPALKRAGLPVVRGDVEIEHIGYLDPQLKRQKQERNLRLLQLDLRDKPDHVVVLFNLGWTLSSLQRAGEALPYLRRTLELNRSKTGYHVPDEWTYRVLTDALLQLGRRQEALEAFAEARQQAPQALELIYREAALRLEMGDAAGARPLLADLTAKLKAAPPSPPARALTQRTEQLLARVAAAAKPAPMPKPAPATIVHAPQELPIVTGQRYLQQGKLDEFRALLARLEASPASKRDAVFLRSMQLLTERQFAEALALIDTLLAQFPRAIHAWELKVRILAASHAEKQAIFDACQALKRLMPENETLKQAEAALKKT